MRARALLAAFCSLPLGASALVILASPPLAQRLPASVRAWLQPLAARVFEIIAQLPPDSIAGRAFYATYDMLVPIFGSAALAAHALLLSLPLVALVVWLARRPRVAAPA